MLISTHRTFYIILNFCLWTVPIVVIPSIPTAHANRQQSHQKELIWTILARLAKLFYLFVFHVELNILAKCLTMYSENTDVQAMVLYLVFALYSTDLVLWTTCALKHIPKAFDRYKSMQKQCMYSIVKRMWVLTFKRCLRTCRLFREVWRSSNLNLNLNIYSSDFEKALLDLSREDESVN